MFKYIREKLEEDLATVEQAATKIHRHINEVYAAAGVPTPSTPLIPWVERLRHRSNTLTTFERWLETETHLKEGKALLTEEDDDFTIDEVFERRREARESRRILTKLRQLINDKETDND